MKTENIILEVAKARAEIYLKDLANIEENIKRENLTSGTANTLLYLINDFREGVDKYLTEGPSLVHDKAEQESVTTDEERLKVEAEALATFYVWPEANWGIMHEISLDTDETTRLYIEC